MAESQSATDWSQLRHAYGSAEDVPALLDKLTPDPAAEVWEELWSRICHQSTVYSASFAALPKLTAVAASWPPADRIMILHLAGAITAGANQTQDERQVREQYANEITALLSLARECLDTPTIFNNKPDEFIYLLGSLFAFEGIAPWNEQLQGLDFGEYIVECPDCETCLYIALGDAGFFSTHEEYAIRKDVPRNPLLPADSSKLDGVAHRLYAMAATADQMTVAKQILHLFGRAKCTVCGTVFAVTDHII